MATLRKSCRQCAASKRHCTVQLPSCARCVQRGLTCVYDLQPLSGIDTQNKCSAGQLLTGPGFDTIGYCVLNRAEVYNKVFGDSLDPAFCPPGHNEAQELIEQCFLRVPELFTSIQPAVFIHPKLQIRKGVSHVDLIQVPLDGVMPHRELEILADIDIGTVSLEEHLTALQALLVFTAPLLVSEQPIKQERAEPWLKIAEVWTQYLLSIASVDALSGRTPWQQWLFAESIRRTIVMAYTLICCFNAWKYGYCSNWLLLESLPFDTRPGLWMAETPQAWIAAAGAGTGQQVGTQLTSVHEFSIKMKSMDSTFCGDVFLSMIAMAHNVRFPEPAPPVAMLVTLTFTTTALLPFNLVFNLNWASLA
ncbi:hypothetical protein BU23DRAFT_592932 [Bimuria novae-zelandiae CBS 107.79]|uniref:Zn(2)-C6 fungal-type domain-containing protein n=1 Tax=Bimuria novae-zelandiae CBS 107.79 TaxID=1447943 RepID=A0A6A5UR19_9PLEO|nr:hypothetical protein BU23DRAFT_592932 [Bimuria novae-zelandiae CBS 107.79]